MSDSTEARISVLERDVSSIYSILGKLDNATSRLTELTSDVRKMLAVHQEKIEHNTERYNLIKQRIDKDIDDLTREIEERYKEIETLINQIEIENSESTRKKTECYNNRLRNLEKSRWLVAGGIAVIVFLGGLIASFFGVTL